MRTALAYLNWSRWVADCPEPGCTDARAVYDPAGRRLAEDVCANGHPFRIEMPSPQLEAQIAAAVAGRVEDADKAWYPKGHVRAVLAGLPTGQSVRELREESEQVATYRAAQRAREVDRLRDLLAGLGVTVNPDGTFEGSL